MHTNDKQNNNDFDVNVSASKKKFDNIMSQYDIKNTVPIHMKFYQEPYNFHRRSKLLLISNILNKNDIFKNKKLVDKYEIIEKLEEACYVYSVEKATSMDIYTSWDNDIFVELYYLTWYRIMINLDPDSMVNNDKLLNDLFNGKLSANLLANMKSMELCPNKYTYILEKIEKSKHVKQTLKTSSLYTCHRCKKNKCLIENVITRSLDEGVSVRVTCANCWYVWVIS